MRLAVVAVLLAVLGCASVSRNEAPPVSPVQPPASSKGAYYKDDGPGANPPPNLAAIPNAVPKTEPLHRFANRPYQVFGKD